MRDLMWTILEEVRFNKRRQYKVKCLCGKVEIRRKDHVDFGRTTSCKSCSAKKTSENYPNSMFTKGHKGVGDITLTLWFKIENGAKRRSIPFDITIQEGWSLFLKQDKRCALSGVNIHFTDKRVNGNPDYKNMTASLDRIDSNKGYTLDNVQWVHKEINYIKKDVLDSVFINWCKLVANNSITKGESCGS